MFFAYNLLTMENKRRPIKSRDTNLARRGARFFAEIGISPNMISVVSIAFAGIALWGFIYSHRGNNEWLLLIAVFGIQMRLLCNLFDGMVAVEYDKTTPMGEVYNDFPDRIADILIIMGVGYYAQLNSYAVEMAWVCSLLAVLTAYIRVLGDSIGTPSFFVGPMAKPHRMFLITIASLLECFLPLTHMKTLEKPYLYYSLWILITGTLLTCINRLLKISKFKRNN